MLCISFHPVWLLLNSSKNTVTYTIIFVKKNTINRYGTIFYLWFFFVLYIGFWENIWIINWFIGFMVFSRISFFLIRVGLGIQIYICSRFLISLFHWTILSFFVIASSLYVVAFYSIVIHVDSLPELLLPKRSRTLFTLSTLFPVYKKSNNFWNNIKMTEALVFADASEKISK